MECIRNIPVAGAGTSTVEECWMRFEVAARQIFSNWTLLRLAVDNGWGGRDSRAKAEVLFNHVLERFKIAATHKNRPVLVTELSNFFNEQLLEQFNAEADDESEDEVSQLLIDVFLSCGKKDFSIADQIARHAKSDPSRCKNQTVHTAEDDESSDDSEGSIEGDHQSSIHHHIGTGAPTAALPFDGTGLDCVESGQYPDEGWKTIPRREGSRR